MGMDNRLRWSSQNSVGFSARADLATSVCISQSTMRRFLGGNMVRIHLTGHGGHAFNSSMQEAETGGCL